MKKGGQRSSESRCGEWPLELLRGTIIGLVNRPGPDLSARQLSILLTCVLDDHGYTVRGLAAALNISKPAVTRAVDRLAEFGLVRRKPDPTDRRSILVFTMPPGRAFLTHLRQLLAGIATPVQRQQSD